MASGDAPVAEPCSGDSQFNTRELSQPDGGVKRAAAKQLDVADCALETSRPFQRDKVNLELRGQHFDDQGVLSDAVHLTDQEKSITIQRVDRRSESASRPGSDGLVGDWKLSDCSTEIIQRSDAR